MNKTNKNIVWNTIGLTLNAFISLFFLIIVRRINGMEIAGIFTYAFSLAMLFYVISNYYNRSYQVANYNNNKSFNQFLSTRIISSLVGFIILCLFLIINRFNFIKNIVIVLLVLFKTIESISDCFFGFFQTSDDLFKSGISYTLKCLIGIIFFIIVDLIFKNIIISLITINVVDLLILYLYDYRQYKKYNTSKIKLDCSNLKLIIIESFSIFIFSFISIYLGNVQKYILTYYETNEIQTIFGILVMPGTMISLIGSYLIMPFITSFKNYYDKKNIKSFNKLTIKLNLILVILGIMCVIIGYFLGIPVLNFIYNVELSKYLMMFIIILVGAILNAICMILSNILIVIEKNTIQLIPYVISSIVGTILSILLISNNGLNGASMAYVLTTLILLIIFIVIYIISIKNINKTLGGSDEKK